MTTIEELEELSASIVAQRDVIDGISEQKKAAEKVLSELEKKMIATLADIGKTSYQSHVGTIGVTHRTSVKLPATPEDREKFFSYLKERGIFEQMITVHSATLNSFYKEALEEAASTGSDFEIPGIGEPVMTETLSVRKLK